MKSIRIISIFLFLTSLSFAQTHFTTVWSSPFMPMNIYVLNAVLDSADLQPGDEAAIFDNEFCVAVATVGDSVSPTTPLSLIASADDPTTAGVDGFITGHIMYFRFWNHVTGREISYVIPEYIQGDSLFAPLGTTVVNLNIVTPVVDLLSPNGGETFVIGTTDTISWNSNEPVTSLMLEYSTDNGVSWNTIEAAADAAPQMYLWAIPDAATTEALIRITSVQDTGFYDVSENAFAIEPFTDIEQNSSLPSRFALLPNYPNPFNPSTTVTYSLPVQSYVNIAVFDLLGSEVAALVSQVRQAGVHAVTFDAGNLQSGVYFLRMTASGFSFTNKIMLLK